ncbi:MAG: LuxR C-terminal-related transcriptional regulator [Caldilineaceae bacterium]
MVYGSAARALIHTKLNRPRVAAQLVDRPRLDALLAAGRTLTTVIAPAGYGKSTLISAWVERCGLRYAWLSLDAGDNDPAVFLSYLSAALSPLSPTLEQEYATSPRGAAASASSGLAHRLADILDKIEEGFVFVLDDYHVIREPAIHLFLSELLHYPPANLHLVVASRVDPPLPLATMRAHNQLTEIRTRELRFTSEEAAAYLAKELEQPLDSSVVNSLLDSTEGWITGLHLATILLRNRDTGQGAVLFHGHNRLAIDYLAAEVLAQRPPEVRTFLLKTSILQRMCPELCDAVLGGTAAGVPPSRQVFDQLEQEDLFLTSLDDSRQWYRYHHLFRQLLLQWLRSSASSTEIHALYAAASRWCSDHNLVGEAISYALAAGDVAQAAELIEKSRPAVMDQENWQQLEEWLHMLPRSAIDGSPQLLIAEAWLMHKYDALVQVPERLDLAQELLDLSDLPDGVKGGLHGEINTLRSQQYYAMGDMLRSYQAARRALDSLPLSKASVRGVAWLYIGGSLAASAGSQTALDALAAARAEDRARRTAVASRTLIAECFIYWTSADLLNLKETAEELLLLARQNRWRESMVWALYFHGCALYALNDLPRAADDFTEVLNQRHSAPGFALVHSAFGLASVLQAQGNEQAAMAVVQMMHDYGRQIGNEPIQHTIAAFQAYLAARQGRSDEGYVWAVGANRSAQSMPMPHFFAAGIAVVAILVQVGTLACLGESEQMLGHLEQYLTATHNQRFLVDVLILKAIVAQAHQQQPKAHDALAEAIARAQPGGLIRPFLDAGPELDFVLHQWKPAAGQEEFYRQIQRERAGKGMTPAAAHAAAGANGSTMAEVVVQPQHPDLIELLTLRELQVLRLLAVRLTNKEIAHALGISVGTVKQHTRSVFSKLHADNRRDAIVQARNMGFQFDTVHSL